MTSSPLDLNVDAPTKVSAVLRAAAEVYYAAHVELAAAWQDKHAGSEWTKIARLLEQAADKIDKIPM